MKVLLDSGTSTLPNEIQVQASSIVVPEAYPTDPAYIYFYGINSNNFDITKSNIKVWNLTKSNWAYGGDSIVTPGNLTVTYNNGTPEFKLELIPFDTENPPFENGDNTKVTIEVPDHLALYSISTNEYKAFLEFSKSAACYSVRLVNASYTGPCMKVRRSNDDATADIPFSFTPDGRALDETALLNFVGSNSAFVDTWYDQSGNDRHASQASTTLQPRIVNAGTIDRINSRPTVLFDGSNDCLGVTTGLNLFQNVDFAYHFSVVKYTAVPTAVQNLFMATVNGSGAARFNIGNSAGSKQRTAARRLDADTTANLDTTVNITTNPTLYFSFVRYVIRDAAVRINNVSNTSNATFVSSGSTSNTASTTIRIGSNAGGTNTFNGSLSELILYNTAPPSVRLSNMNTSIMSYYGIS